MVRFDNTPPIVFNGNITNPVTENNYSGNLILNSSVVDALATVRAVAFNITNSTSDQTNGTSFANAIRIGTQIGVTFFNYTINTAQFPDGLYNISILANDTTNGGNINNSAVLRLVRFDNTAPRVFNNNISLPLAGTNHSGTKVFNVSLLDALTGIRGVAFNITNGTGTQNASYTATREGTTTQYSVSVSTAGFKDGNYTITIFANDTAGNLNNSARATEVLFDNTAPTVTVSCSPATVTAGESITCTCARSDATSGINVVNFVANPSTSSTGTFTSECTVSDKAGNSATGSTTYRVESGGSGASSGGGGGGGSSSTGETTEWKTTYTVSDDALKDGTETRELRKSQRLKINVDVGSVGGGSSGKTEEHYVGVVDIVDKTKAIIEVSSTPQRFELAIGGTKDVDLDGDKKDYDLRVKLESILGSKAEITVMPISELIPQPPTAPVPEPTPLQEAEPEVVTAPPQEETRSSAGMWIGIIIIVLIIAGIVVWLVMQRR